MVESSVINMWRGSIDGLASVPCPRVLTLYRGGNYVLKPVKNDRDDISRI